MKLTTEALLVSWCSTTRVYLSGVVKIGDVSHSISSVLTGKLNFRLKLENEFPWLRLIPLIRTALTCHELNFLCLRSFLVVDVIWLRCMQTHDPLKLNVKSKYIESYNLRTKKYILVRLMSWLDKVYTILESLPRNILLTYHFEEWYSIYFNALFTNL